MIYKALTLFNTLRNDILNDEIIQIKNVKFPNFFNTGIFNIQFEFCHQFIELYEDYVLNPNGCICYEIKDLIEISEKDVVIDCGANMGFFAAYAASKGATVYCFEPCKSVRENFLTKTKEIYGDKITIFPYALGSIASKENFLHTPNIGANHLAKNRVNLELPIIGQEEVEIVTLDDFLSKQNIIPTFIKADIEGSEKEMLIGAKNILRTYQPKLSISHYHNPKDLMSIADIIEKINPDYEKMVLDNLSCFWIGS